MDSSNKYLKDRFGRDITQVRSLDIYADQYTTGVTADIHGYRSAGITAAPLTFASVSPAVPADNIASFVGINHQTAKLVSAPLSCISSDITPRLYNVLNPMCLAGNSPGFLTNPTAAVADKYQENPPVIYRGLSGKDTAYFTADSVYARAGIFNNAAIGSGPAISGTSTTRSYITGSAAHEPTISFTASKSSYLTYRDHMTGDLTASMCKSIYADNNEIWSGKILQEKLSRYGSYAEKAADAFGQSTAVKRNTELSIYQTAPWTESVKAEPDIRVSSNIQRLKGLRNCLFDLTEREQYLAELFEGYTLWSEDAYGIFRRWQNELEFRQLKKSIARLEKTIFRLGRHITRLQTKLKQGRRLNKRQIFRVKVNLIFKNLDDAHVVEGYPLFNCNSLSTAFLNNRYYEYRYQ